MNSTQRSDTKPSPSDHFSWLRTRLAVERTLLAWVRTSVSLIGFGFTIVVFFEGIEDFYQAAVPRLPDAPRYLGLALILLGVASLMISMIEYRKTNEYIRSGDFAAISSAEGLPKRTPLYLVAVTLCLIGMFCFLAILTRLV